MLKNPYILDNDEIVTLGASLRQIEQKFLKKGQKNGVNRVWFQGIEPYFDVFFELENDEIVWFQFTFRGKFITWNQQKTGWETGNTNELNVDDRSFYPASKIMESDNKLDWEFINLVKIILQTRAQETIFAKALALFDEAPRRPGAQAPRRGVSE